MLISLPHQSERHDFYLPTSCIDLLPTLLLLTGKEIPEFLEGEVLPGFMTDSSQGRSNIYALEAKLSSKQDPTRICTAAMISGQYKLIRYQGYEDELDDELYDLANDPEEMDDLAAVNNRLAAEMGAELNLKLDKK
jgi:arylsulfatase A-like enzyme